MKKRLFRLGALCCVAAMTITTGAQALSVEEAYDILQRSYVDKLPRAAQDAKSLDELFSYGRLHVLHDGGGVSGVFAGRRG